MYNADRISREEKTAALQTVLPGKDRLIRKLIHVECRSRYFMKGLNIRLMLDKRHINVRTIHAPKQINWKRAHYLSLLGFIIDKQDFNIILTKHAEKIRSRHGY